MWIGFNKWRKEDYIEMIEGYEENLKIEYEREKMKREEMEW